MKNFRILALVILSATMIFVSCSNSANKEIKTIKDQEQKMENNKKVLAFDIYGSLIDTKNITSKFDSIVPDLPADFAKLWTSKIIEYGFRKGLMGTFTTHAECKIQALDFVLMHYNLQISGDQKSELIHAFEQLPAFSEVNEGLSKIDKEHYALIAFTSGDKNDIEMLLDQAGIINLFDQVITTSTVDAIKPQAKAYQYLVDETGVNKENICLISSNPFDIIGSMHFGFNAIWVKRNENAIFDPWDMQPTAVISSYLELASCLN